MIIILSCLIETREINLMIVRESIREMKKWYSLNQQGENIYIKRPDLKGQTDEKINFDKYSLHL